MPLPKRIKIGHHSWRIRAGRIRSADDEFYYGITHRKKTRIDIDDTVSPSQVRDTALHEAIHAVLTDSPVRFSYDDEERIVRAITPGLLAALRDNPEFIAFLLEE